MPFTVLVGTYYNFYHYGDVKGADGYIAPSYDPRNTYGRGIYKGDTAMYFAPEAMQDGLTMKQVYDAINESSGLVYLFDFTQYFQYEYTNLKINASDLNGSAGNILLGQEVDLDNEDTHLHGLKHNIRFFEWNAITETSDAQCDEEYIYKVLRDNIRRYFNGHDAYFENFTGMMYFMANGADKSWNRLWIWNKKGYSSKAANWYSGIMASKFVSGNGDLAWMTDLEAEAVLSNYPGNSEEYVFLDGTNIYEWDMAGRISQEYIHGSTKIVNWGENNSLYYRGLDDNVTAWSIMPVLEKHNLYQCKGHTVTVQIKFNPDATGVTNPTPYMQDIADTTTTVTLTSNQFVRPGYKVVGWASVPSGTKRWDNGGTFSGQHRMLRIMRMVLISQEVLLCLICTQFGSLIIR